MSIEEIEREALQLDPRLRARLAESLLGSLDMLSESENESLWIEEAQRRDDEFEAGVAQERPASDVFRDARLRLS